jgi:formate-dependent nitrite reductase membrane component NrfD
VAPFLFLLDGRSAAHSVAPFLFLLDGRSAAHSVAPFLFLLDGRSAAHAAKDSGAGAAGRADLPEGGRHQ